MVQSLPAMLRNSYPKTMPTFLLRSLPLAAAGLCLQANLFANDGILVERIEVDAALGSRMLAEGLGGEALRGALAKHIAEGDATLVEEAYIAGLPERKLALTSAHELIYPTEYDPPEIPQKLRGPIEPGTRLITGAAPGAFEMRRIGLHLAWEGERFVAGGAWKEAQLSLAATSVKGQFKYGADASLQKMPHIASQGLGGNQFRLRPERSELLGVHQRLRVPNRLVFVLGRLLLQVAPLPRAPIPEPLVASGRISITAELIEVSAGQFAEVMEGSPQIAHWSAQREELEAKIDAGEATMLASTTMETRPGSRVRGGTTTEYIYPVSGDPPEIPQQLAAPPADTRPLITAKAVTSAEMRPLGFMVEADPKLERGLVQLSIAIEHATHDRDVEYGQDEGVVRQPVFDTLKVASAVQLGRGSDMLLGAMTPRASGTGEPLSNRRVLVFVRAEVAEVVGR